MDKAAPEVLSGVQMHTKLAWVLAAEVSITEDGGELQVCINVEHTCLLELRNINQTAQSGLVIYLG